MRPAHLLVLHQGAELYGSDRSLLELLEGLDRERFRITVVLPEDGPLAAALARAGIATIRLPVGKISRSALSPAGLLRLAREHRAAMRGLDALHAAQPVHLVYSNTLAVWAGARWARRRALPHVWHVREIIGRPAWASAMLRAGAQRGAARLICNSEPTRDWLDAGVAPARRKSVVVWNGIDGGAPPPPAERAAARAALGLPPGLPLLLLVGRVNAWKGQDLLLDAIDRLPAEPAFAVALVGGPPPGQPQWMQRLHERVARSPHAARVQVQAFVPDPTRFYAAADIAVVPSREPEPFGRVAVEAMAAGLPVVAARHGGLSHIVDDGVSGALVPPNDADALAAALARLLQAGPEVRERLGRAGRERQQRLFSLEATRRGVVAVFDELLHAGAGAGRAAGADAVAKGAAR